MVMIGRADLNQISSDCACQYSSFYAFFASAVDCIPELARVQAATRWVAWKVRFAICIAFVRLVTAKQDQV